MSPSESNIVSLDPSIPGTPFFYDKEQLHFAFSWIVSTIWNFLFQVVYDFGREKCRKLRNMGVRRDRTMALMMKTAAQSIVTDGTSVVWWDVHTLQRSLLNTAIHKKCARKRYNLAGMHDLGHAVSFSVLWLRYQILSPDTFWSDLTFSWHIITGRNYCHRKL